ncbi:MAG: TCP-1/cpn60 chaperonin family protein, partial [Halobacteriales archaeon]|nr:TCP-1/cpn60 chaperonin family protein [Halobacteriales archaeon]
VHPASITQGYTEAVAIALDLLDEIAIDVDSEDLDLLTRVAMTAMTDRGAEDVSELLAELVVEATRSVADDGEVDDENVQTIKVTGGRIQDSHYLEGVVIEKERIHPEMPLMVEDATVLLVDPDIRASSLSSDGEATITEPDGFRKLIDSERTEMESLIEGLAERGVNVVICKQHIDDMARKLMAREGIYAAQYVKKDELKLIARATGAGVVSDLRDIDDDDLGYAGMVSETDIDGELRTVIEDVHEAKAVTLLLRGASMNVLDELDRSIEDGIAAIAAVLEDGRVLPGGGAAEAEIALALRREAPKTGAREALAIEAFADAVAAIPQTLAENAGANPIDGLVELIAAHDGGAVTAGIDEITGAPTDMLEEGVLEPLAVKRRALQHATDAAVLVLRVDDIMPTSAEALTELDKKGSVPAQNMPDKRLGALEREQLAKQGELDPTEGFDRDASPV